MPYLGGRYFSEQRLDHEEFGSIAARRRLAVSDRVQGHTLYADVMPPSH